MHAGVRTENFLPAFRVYYKDNESLGRFLAAWYKEIGTLVCDSLSTQTPVHFGVTSVRSLACSAVVSSPDLLASESRSGHFCIPSKRWCWCAIRGSVKYEIIKLKCLKRGDMSTANVAFKINEVDKEFGFTLKEKQKFTK